MNTGTYTITILFKDGSPEISKTAAYHYDIDFQLDWLADKLYRAYDFQNIMVATVVFDSEYEYTFTPESNYWKDAASEFSTDYISGDELPEVLLSYFGVAYMANYHGNSNKYREVHAWLKTVKLDPQLSSAAIENIIITTADNASDEYHEIPGW